jgi:DNA-binding PadR family transcriptional regulator
MPTERNITDLEGAVLGVIGVKGPCTPYAVRKEFQESATPYWSGSSGTIYPVIDRLTNRKLIHVASLTEDGRGGKRYVLTKRGERTLKDWLYPAAISQIVGTPPDPLRSRVEFLGLLDSEKRNGFLREVRLGLEEQLKNATKKCEEIHQLNDLDYLSIRGVILAAEARLTWITEIVEILSKQD